MSNFGSDLYQGGRKGESFQRLSQIIATNVQKITQNVSSLQKMVQQLGTENDNQELRNRLHQIQHYTNQLAKDTNKYMFEISELPLPASQSEQRQCRIQRERLKNDFTTALTSFQSTQRLAAQREKEDFQKTKMQTGSQFDLGYPGQKHQRTLIDLDSPVADDPSKMINRTQLQLEDEADIQSLREREKAIKQLESDIVDVNQIFKELASLVHEQGETIDSIEANVESAQMEVQQGAQQLGAASSYQSKIRRRKLCLFITFCVVLVILIIIVSVYAN